MEPENKKSLAFYNAKKKVETLKGFYQHLIAFVLVNSIIILVQSGIFRDGRFDISSPEIYFTTFMWGIGLVSHLFYVLFVMNFNNNFIKKWEERKIKEFMEEEG